MGNSFDNLRFIALFDKSRDKWVRVFLLSWVDNRVARSLLLRLSQTSMICSISCGVISSTCSSKNWTLKARISWCIFAFRSDCRFLRCEELETAAWADRLFRFRDVQLFVAHLIEYVVLCDVQFVEKDTLTLLNSFFQLDECSMCELESACLFYRCARRCCWWERICGICDVRHRYLTIDVFHEEVGSWRRFGETTTNTACTRHLRYSFAVAARMKSFLYVISSFPFFFDEENIRLQFFFWLWF